MVGSSSRPPTTVADLQPAFHIYHLGRLSHLGRRVLAGGTTYGDFSLLVVDHQMFQTLLTVDPRGDTVAILDL